jgi:hypothetical protein
MTETVPHTQGENAMQPIPPSIVKAIVTVQASIGAVHKDGKNTHGGYQFASTDAIYAALTLKLAAAGLTILCLEETPPEIVRFEKNDDGKVKTSQWGKFSFTFVLATEEATWQDPRSRRSLYIQITGPQTFMAAQSFAEKTYLRSLFKLPTGDMDLDAMPQGDTEEDQVSLSTGNGSKRKSSAEGKRDGSVKRFNEIRAAINSAANIDIVKQIRTLFAEEWATLPRAWADTLDEEYEMKMSGFQEAA